MQRLRTIALECSLHSQPDIVQIVSYNRFVAELLANYLVSNEQLLCRRCPVETQRGDVSDIRPDTCLVIIDAEELDLASQWEMVLAVSPLPAHKTFCALFNVDPQAGIDTEALRFGIRGLFCRSDSPEAISKGVVKILNGEVWHQRETMFNYIVGGQPEQRLRRREPLNDISLTMREKKILRHLSSGATNQDIADQMVVSIHTVKSHLYKIYRKINVPNRLQATLWATSNLEYS